MIFVYGTLRNHRVGGDARLIGFAKTRGRLYQVDPAYPGMVPAESTQDWVSGEVYELSTPEATLARLDDYEGEEFVRCRRTAWLDDGPQVEVWMYLYYGTVREQQRIWSGDYHMGGEHETLDVQ